MSFKNPSNSQFSTKFSLNDIASLEGIEKEIDEIEIYLKSNYSTLMVNIIEFKPQMEFYLNNLKYSKQKLNFIIMSIDRTEENLKAITSLMDKIKDIKEQVELILRMRELKTKTDLKKTLRV